MPTRIRELLGNLGNIALLRIAGELGLIDAGLATRVGDAYRDVPRGCSTACGSMARKWRALRPTKWRNARRCARAMARGFRRRLKLFATLVAR